MPKRSGVMLRIDVWDEPKGKTQAFQFPAVSRCGLDSSKKKRPPLKLMNFHITAVYREHRVHGFTVP